jgi:hypothetical protein
LWGAVGERPLGQHGVQHRALTAVMELGLSRGPRRRLPQFASRRRGVEGAGQTSYGGFAVIPRNARMGCHASGSTGRTQSALPKGLPAADETLTDSGPPVTAWSRRNRSHVTKRIDSTGIPGKVPHHLHTAR